MAEGGWKRSPVVAVIAVVVLIAAGIFIFSRLSGGRGGSAFVGDQFFFDLTTGELIASDSGKSPIETANGHEAVRAHVFSCSNCEDQSSRFIGHLTKYTDKANAAMDIPREKREPFVIQSGTLVSGHADDPDWEPNWVEGESAQGMAIQESAHRKCETFKVCVPP